MQDVYHKSWASTENTINCSKVGHKYVDDLEVECQRICSRKAAHKYVGEIGVVHKGRYTILDSFFTNIFTLFCL